jgi:N-acetylneuraminate synthase
MQNQPVQIANYFVGDNHPAFIIGEIGINHNGSLDIARNLISIAKNAGCNAVKFQKRTVDVVYTAEELAKPRESPFGNTNGDLKRGLEFGFEQYKEIDEFCREVEILWFASAWDEASVDFIDQFPVPCYKIASASLTDDNLLKHTRSKGKPILLSTGMSTIEEIDHAVEILGKDDLVILHATSTYPSNYNEIDLRVIAQLRSRYAVPVGYSGHETGIATSVAAVALGACVVERHITIERSMWGSDQAASLGPSGLTQMVRDIRLVETAFGSSAKRVFDSEIPIRKKLRRVGLKA